VLGKTQVHALFANPREQLTDFTVGSVVVLSRQANIVNPFNQFGRLWHCKPLGCECLGSGFDKPVCGSQIFLVSPSQCFSLLGVNNRIRWDFLFFLLRVWNGVSRSLTINL